MAPPRSESRTLLRQHCLNRNNSPSPARSPASSTLLLRLCLCTCLPLLLSYAQGVPPALSPAPSQSTSGSPTSASPTSASPASAPPPPPSVAPTAHSSSPPPSPLPAPSPGPGSGQQQQAPSGAAFSTPGYVFIDCGAEGELTNDKWQAKQVPLPGSANGTNSSSSNASSISYFVSGGPSLYPTYTISPSFKYSGQNPYNSSSLSPAERTLRAFPPQGGCYYVETTKAGPWLVRLGFAYFNYDKQLAYPNFTVSIGTQRRVDAISLADWENTSLDEAATAPGGPSLGVAHYTEYLVSLSTENTMLQVCLTSTDGKTPPILNTLELVPYRYVMDAAAEMPELNSSSVPGATPTWALSLKHRFSVWGAPVSPATDPLGRHWDTISDIYGVIYFTFQDVPGTVPYYWIDQLDLLFNNSLPHPIPADPTLPPELFTTALYGGSLNSLNPYDPQFLGVGFNYFPLDPTNHLLARLFFSELNSSVADSDRVFNISFAALVTFTDPGSGKVVTKPLPMQWEPVSDSQDFDIEFRSGGPWPAATVATFFGCHPDPPSGGGMHTKTTLTVFLTADGSSLPPSLCGLEIYEVVGSELPACQPPADEVLAALMSDYPAVAPPPAPPSGLSGGAIFGIVLLVLVGVALLAVLGVFLYRRRSEAARATAFQRFESQGFH